MEISRVLAFLLLVALTSSAVAEIKNVKITSDSRPMILFERFGFTPLGEVEIAVSDVTFDSKLSQPDPSLLGFFLLSEENLIQAHYESRQQQTVDANSNPNGNGISPLCVLSSPYVQTLFTFRDLTPPNYNSYNRSFPIAKPDEYSLLFANCAPETVVTMSIHTEMYNARADRSRDYLSVGQAPLPTLYFFFSVAYIGFFAFWVYLVAVKNRLSAHRIHVLMAGLLVFKALNLLFAAEDQHYVRSTGTPHGWDVLFYIFQFLRIALLFTVIVLIGTGWSFLKPFLQDREKKVLMFVIPLQVIANVARAVMGETGPFIPNWVTWLQVFLLIELVCCFAILFPIIWSIRSLQETSKTDGKAARNLAKLRLFRQFYIIVVGYLYFTRIVVLLLKTIAAYKYQWVSTAAEEIVSLAFYIKMFYMFRPVERNQYFALDDDEEAEAQAALREEEFEL